MKKIKKFLLISLAALMMASTSACAATKQCEADSLIDAAADAEEVSACVYDNGEEKILKLEGGNVLAKLFEGEWNKIDGMDGGKKVLSVVVATQYEVCFFDNGTAMIYYGYCGVFEKDRQYYSVSLDTDLDSLVEYVMENGTVVDDEAE